MSVQLRRSQVEYPTSGCRFAYNAVGNLDAARSWTDCACEQLYGARLPQNRATCRRYGCCEYMYSLPAIHYHSQVNSLIILPMLFTLLCYRPSVHQLSAGLSPTPPENTTTPENATSSSGRGAPTQRVNFSI